ncbi:MAG: PIN-like domain-containing protein [Eisenbergiella massiliensis]
MIKKKKGQEDDNNAYGDLIIWKQIIKYAKENGTGVVYVTHDQKRRLVEHCKRKNNWT